MVDTIATALAQAQSLQQVSDSWRLDAELLLIEVLGCRREQLMIHPEKSLTMQQSAQFTALLDRRLQQEPIAYILGRKAFWDFDVAVSPAVLIPRPETEVLVEQALARVAAIADQPLQVADLGTGSGVIALALARSNPHWQVTATDYSEPALAVARANAKALSVHNIDFRQGSWCDALPDIEYDLLVSNPPYVAEGDAHLQADGLPFEPPTALTAGENGLADIRNIIEQSAGSLKKDSWLLFEHGFDQADALRMLLRENGFRDVFTEQDYGKQDRVSGGRR
ncbi:MAG: peptide chain release factor N(5)-glutamine methyltransferase [Gammaproteobacteria bacterium]